MDSLGLQKYAGHIILLTVAVGVIWIGRANLMSRVPARVNVSTLAALGEAVPTRPPAAPSLAAAPVDFGAGDLTRLTELHTYIPDRPRREITEYVAQPSDTIFGIAEKFGLKPETIMWGNPALKDNPHFLEPGQTLRIAPIDGVIRDVVSGDTIGGLARAYGVKPEAIINWPANNIDPDSPQIIAGQALFVPGGSRGPIQFTQDGTAGGVSSGSGTTGGGNAGSSPKAPYVLKSGAGQCPGGYSGAAGSGGFIWPAANHYLSGYDYSGIHPGIDIAGGTGDAVYASDSGVIVFAGWSDWGYGNTVIVDHGNNWWTLYAHLSQWNVDCGQGVYQGTLIGAVGTSGRAKGSHLHFEMYYGAFQVNPWSYLPPP